MELINQYCEIFDDVDGIAICKKLERIGRTCYKSENMITDASYIKFLSNIISSGHESVIEHCSITVKFVTDRGVTHEIVRHRLASYTQESTRYCNYTKDKFGNQLKFILPVLGIDIYKGFEDYCKYIEETYNSSIYLGATPQEARAYLPNCIKTELFMTCNLREWRHFFELRCSPKAHPQLRALANDLLDMFHTLIPVIFDDIWNKYHQQETDD